MKIRMQLFLGAALAVPVSLIAGVTRDANGWTQVTPSADSRVIYVSSSDGNDNDDGLTEATAKATINGTNGANSLMRSGFPDHMLLKRGDTFSTGSLGNWKSGRNANEPIVISYYGTATARPVIKITNFFIDHNGAVRNYIFLKGIEVYKSNSDPNSPDYTGASCTNSIRFVGGGANIRIEDCRLRFLEVTVQDYNGNIYTNFEFRRNIVLDAWKANSFNDGLARIQGIFMTHVVGYEFEENFFDHNGWSEQVSGAGANQFNHNAYIQYTNSEGGLFRGNIFARGAAHGLQARSAGIIDRNLFVLNAISFNIGGVDYPTDPDVPNYPNVALDNVVLNGRLMSTVNTNYPRTGALWGVWEDIYVQDAFVDGNIVANKVNTGTNDQSYNGISHMDFGSNISYNWTPSLDTFNASWPHPNDDLGDYYASIGGTNSTTAYLDFLRNRTVGTLPWNMTAYAAINYIRAGFLQPAITGPYNYGGSSPSVTIAATDATASETSNSGQFTVTANPAPASPLTVNLSRSGTATNGSDYTSIATTVVVPTSGSVTIPVTVTDDQLVESSETVMLTVTSGTGYTVGSPSAATVTISDNDTGVIAAEGAGFQTTAITAQTGTFTATFYATPSVNLIDTPIGLSQISPTAFTDLAAIVLFNNVGNIQARNGGVYAAASTIPYSGGTTYFFRMVVNVPAKTYSAYVTPAGGAEITIGTNYAFRSEQSGATSLNFWSARTNAPTGSSTNVSNFTVTAVTTPVVTIAATDASAGETSNSGTFTVTASPAPSSPLTVNLSRSGAATNGSDYTSIATTATVPTSGSVTIPVTATNDQLVESSETVTLTITSGTGYTVGAANSATVTITDNDTGVIAAEGGGFQTTAITPSQGGLFTATFYATPSVNMIDTPIGLSPVSPTAFTDLAAIVLFNNVGNIQARNGGAYAAASTIPYCGGTTYFFRLVINVWAKTYSAYVTPTGGSEITIGANYAFRSEQSGATSLNYWSARTNSPTGASCNVSNFTIIPNLVSYGTFEPSQATVLQDMASPFTLGTNPNNIWQGRVGGLASQNTTYQTEGSNHYVTIGNSTNTNGCFQVITWPGSGTKTLSFSYRGTATPFVRIYGGNTGNTIDKFSGSNSLTLIQQFNESNSAAWSTATHSVNLTGSYNYLVIMLRTGDFDNVLLAP